MFPRYFIRFFSWPQFDPKSYSKYEQQDYAPWFDASAKKISHL